MLKYSLARNDRVNINTFPQFKTPNLKELNIDFFGAQISQKIYHRIITNPEKLECLIVDSKTTILPQMHFPNLRETNINASNISDFLRNA